MMKPAFFRKLLLSLFGMSGLIIPVFAEPAQQVQIDRNQDQRIDLEEFYATGPAPLHPRMKQVFEAFDLDHDGFLSLAETREACAKISSLRPKLKPEVDGASQAVPLEISPKSKRAVVKATINGVEGRFLLDTGCSDTILDTDFARRAKVDFVEACMGIAAGNYGKKGDVISFIRVPDLEIAGTHFRDFHAIMQDQNRPRSDFTGRLDGLIGANLLFAKPLTLDFRQQQLRFATAADAAKPHDFTFNLLLNRRKTDPARRIEEVGSKTALIEAEIDGVKVILLLDSGAAIGDTLLINQTYHEAFRKLANEPQAQKYTAKEVRVGDKTLLNSKLCLLRSFEESVLGAVFFDGHIITVDLAAGKVFIDRNPEKK